MITEFKINKEELQDRINEVTESIDSDASNGDIVPAMIKAIMRRFNQHGLKRYTDYGVYWYALKDVLSKYGHNFGDTTDSEIKYWYRGSNDIETVIMADMFRTYAF